MNLDARPEWLPGDLPVYHGVEIDSK